MSASLLNLQLVDIILTFKIGFFRSQFLANKWGSLYFINVALFATNSNVIFIFGVMVAQIGAVSSNFGSWNVMLSGFWLVPPKSVLLWA